MDSMTAQGFTLQMGFNIALILISALGGYVLKSINASLASLQQNDIKLAEKVQKVEVLVAGQYATHVDVEKMGNALFAKLDKIYDKLDKKQDKP